MTSENSKHWMEGISYIGTKNDVTYARRRQIQLQIECRKWATKAEIPTHIKTFCKVFCISLISHNLKEVVL